MSISNNQSDTDQEDTTPSTTTPEFVIPPSPSSSCRITTTPEATEVTLSNSHIVIPDSPASVTSTAFTNSVSLLKTNETTTIDLMALLPKDCDKTPKIGANVKPSDCATFYKVAKGVLRKIQHCDPTRGSPAITATTHDGSRD